MELKTPTQTRLPGLLVNRPIITRPIIEVYNYITTQNILELAALETIHTVADLHSKLPGVTKKELIVSPDLLLALSFIYL